MRLRGKSSSNRLLKKPDTFIAGAASGRMADPVTPATHAAPSASRQTHLEMLIAAITALHRRSGCSLRTIERHILEHLRPTSYQRHRLKLSVKRCLENGRLVAHHQRTKCYKLPPAAKRAKQSKTPRKKPAATRKKPAAKSAKRPAKSAKRPAKAGAISKGISKATARKPKPQKAQKAKPQKKQPASSSAAAASSSAAASATHFVADAAAVEKAGAEDIQQLQVTAHHKLVLTDLSQNMDKFMVIQTLRGRCRNKDVFLFCARWGRTGTAGQAQVQGPFESPAEAASLIATKFEEKTGNNIAAAAAGFSKKPGKYDLVRGSTGAAVDTGGAGGRCLWQYWVDDRVDGKEPGWYDYAQEAAAVVEGVYSEWVNNPDSGLAVRCVQSGHFSYHVSFADMKQTNVTHPARRQRQIRRNAV